MGKELVEDLIKSLKLKYCSKSSLPKVLSNTTAQKITEDTRKVKKLQKRVKTERALAVCLTTKKMTLQHRLSPENTKNFRMTFSKNTFEELLIVFQLFKQFDLEIRQLIFKLQMLFRFGVF